MIRDLLAALPLLLLALVALPGCPVADDDDDVAGDDDATGDDDDCPPGDPAVTEIEPDDLAAMLDSGEDFLLINTHVPYAGEIPGTDAHIAYTDEAGFLDYLGDDLSVVVVVYCATGPMSASVANALVDDGYCNIHDMPGGMSAWQQAGYEID